MVNFAANQIYRIMYSSEDLERFYFQYQTEALPRGESLQSFCVKNKVPYNIFQKWFKDTRKKVVEVQVDGASIGDRPKSVSRNSNNHLVRIWIDIRISNGLQKNDLYKNIKLCFRLLGIRNWEAKSCITVLGERLKADYLFVRFTIMMLAS